MRPIDADAVCERCKASGAICTGKDCEIPTMPTITPQNEPRMINADKLAKRIAGHSNYHGDSILAAIYCAAEGKENDNPIRPIEAPPNEWVSVEERLPEDDAPKHKVEITVLVLTDREDVKIKNRTYHPARFYYGKFYPERWDWGTFNDDRITHWMPRPTPPGKDNNISTKAPNEPLTIEQLREMDGEPVYVVPANEYSELGKWCVISIGGSDDYSCALVPGVEYWSWAFECYGEQWLAYRRPPEKQEDIP